MRQHHAKAHFDRVAVIKAAQHQMLADYRARWIGGNVNRDVYETPRYRRLCRIVALYRTAGYLNP